MKRWEPVTKIDQLKVGTMIKIVGFAPKNSYRWITVKQVLHMENSERSWVEIIINKKKNYYFNLTAYLNDEDTWGKWVKELYFRTS